MKTIDSKIIGFIEKYPFFTDPIVLFNPDRIPSKEEILKGNLNLEYPEINKFFKRIDNIKNDFFELKELVEGYNFNNTYLSIEYLDRIEDFYKVIRIIECFYNEEEYEKYNLINEYFGIDFKLLNEIFHNKNILIDEFKNIEGKLNKKQVQYLDNTLIKDEEIKKYFLEAIKYLGLEKNWKVKIGNVVSIVHTNFTEKGGDIIIPKDREISLKKLLTLIAHEIDGHCVQFSNASGLLSGSIRFSKSESLLEGYAMYIEYLMESYLTGKNSIKNLINRNKIKFSIIKNIIDIEKYIELYNDCINFRFFRGFNDIKRYKNLKDFVYIEGIYKIIKYRNTYSNFLELIKKGAINDSYILNYGECCGRKGKIKIKETSAFYILNKYFKI